MNQSFKSLCSEFTKQTRFKLSLLPQIPNDKILTVMAKDGWKKVAVEITPEQIACAASAAGHGVLFLPTDTIKNAAGQDAIMGGDPELYTEYKQAVRRAAAQVYGINLK